MMQLTRMGLPHFHIPTIPGVPSSPRPGVALSRFGSSSRVVNSLVSSRFLSFRRIGAMRHLCRRRSCNDDGTSTNANANANQPQSPRPAERINSIGICEATLPVTVTVVIVGGNRHPYRNGMVFLAMPEPSP
jgi:hypothetical protein